MKKITSNIACFISGIIIASTVGAIAATYTATPNEFPIKVNGQDAQMEGYNIDGSTYFKLRDIGDCMGFNVGFENNTILIGDNNTAKKEDLFKDVNSFFEQCITKTKDISDSDYEVVKSFFKSVDDVMNEMRKSSDVSVEKCEIIQAVVDTGNNLINVMQNDTKIQNNRNNPNYIDDIFTSSEYLLKAYSDYQEAYAKYKNM